MLGIPSGVLSQVLHWLVRGLNPSFLLSLAVSGPDTQSRDSQPGPLGRKPGMSWCQRPGKTQQHFFKSRRQHTRMFVARKGLGTKNHWIYSKAGQKTTTVQTHENCSKAEQTAQPCSKGLGNRKHKSHGQKFACDTAGGSSRLLSFSANG